MLCAESGPRKIRTAQRSVMMSAIRRREFVVGTTVIAVIAGLGIASTGFERRAAAQAAAAVQAPMFEVDPLWPKPLPNHWVTGNNIGIAADSQDHIWMIHRISGVPAQFKGDGAACCTTAPPIMGFDQAGNLIGNWGGPGQGYEWPQSEHGLWIDYQGNFWIGGNGEKDTQVLKFTPAGKFLLQIGKQGAPNDSNDTKNLGKPADGTVDRAANEVYVADGYGNRRVIVFDAQTGAYKRHWGAYGNKPDDTNLGNYNPAAPPAQQFRPSAVHCAEISNDNFVYVCDRANDRMQIFQKNGTFVKEKIIAKDTKGGSVWDIAWSRDPQQTYMYVADGSNHTIHILLRSTLEELTSFGIGGQQPGQFYGAHNVITDSKGNLYVAETYGTRIQKFVYKGIGPVTKKEQGAPWPKTAN
jgi:DNA-binding beta-propeller fold protein YncE